MPKLLILFFIPFFCFSASGQAPRLYIIGADSSDVVRILKANHIPFQFCTTMDRAASELPDGAGLLVLAGKYPSEKVNIPAGFFQKLERKNIRAYIEYPSLPDDKNARNDPRKITIERGVVTSTAVGLDTMRILSVNDHWFIPMQMDATHIVLGKVAGYDRADFGISDITTWPLLGIYQGSLVASTKLSDVLTSRFGPSDAWKKVWGYILGYVLNSDNAGITAWPADVKPNFLPTETPGKKDTKEAIVSGLEWFYNARLLIDASWADTLENRTAPNGIKVVHPAMPEGSPAGNGSHGILEGHASYINADGSQPVRWWVRGDCQAEAAYALAAGTGKSDPKKYKKTAQHLLQYLYKTSNLRSGERNDPASPSFGLIGWATTDPDAYYGDDNARALLATIGASNALSSRDWDPYILEGILGNFRTAGELGFRGPWFRDAAMQKTSWQQLGERDIINIHPHYESWLWACYLWLYDKNGHLPLLQKAEKAIRITMEAFPDWKWTNGIQQEYARMLLPLAWLYRVQPSPEHRKWLDMVAGKLLEDLQPSGAIREKLGKEGKGRYGRILSNEEYGSKEAPLLSNPGDPVADMLYTMNFALFSLNEAAAATNDSTYKEAVNRMADFLVRIQVSSECHPELDGAWLRAFDYQQWEYWASNADSGWGPWGSLTGWTQSWIITGLRLRSQNQNFWDQTADHYSKKSFKRMAKQKINAMLDTNRDK